ncbi:MAG: RNase H-like domain-containing protein, partial [Clostridium sp.]|uniref:RNase H-like domain-containing protein n=1 Tax=Clostridium sp. TaxID=1506 RepID=UPI003F3D9313
MIESQEAIEQYKKPSNRNEVQRFVGLVNYYRKFIPRCLLLLEPISRLISTKVPFYWQDEQEEAFVKLKKILLSSLVLAQPDFTKIFTFETDASTPGVASILPQGDEKDKVPIMFISTKLRDSELNYSISEKECLAALWAMEKLKYFLYGREFDLITDHQALEALNNGEMKSQRIERWLERLNVFLPVIQYRKGEEIPHVDALSRSLTSEKDMDIATVSAGSLNEAEPIEYEKIIIIRKKHIDLVHRGYKIVLNELKQTYKWKDLNTLVRKVLQKCKECKEYNAKKKTRIRFVNSFEKGEKMAVDIIGPINGRYIISAIDYFSRKGFAKVISSRSAKAVVKFLDEVVQELPFRMLIMDQAKEFLSREVSVWTQRRNINLHFTTPFHHQSNGRVERFNRTLQEGIFKSKDKESLKDITA